MSQKRDLEYVRRGVRRCFVGAGHAIVALLLLACLACVVLMIVWPPWQIGALFAGVIGTGALYEWSKPK